MNSEILALSLSFYFLIDLIYYLFLIVKSVLMNLFQLYHYTYNIIV